MGRDLDKPGGAALGLLLWLLVTAALGFPAIELRFDEAIKTDECAA
jgi:hypothetical protein